MNTMNDQTLLPQKLDDTLNGSYYLYPEGQYTPDENKSNKYALVISINSKDSLKSKNSTTIKISRFFSEYGYYVDIFFNKQSKELLSLCERVSDKFDNDNSLDVLFIYLILDITVEDSSIKIINDKDIIIQDIFNKIKLSSKITIIFIQSDFHLENAHLESLHTSIMTLKNIFIISSNEKNVESILISQVKEKLDKVEEQLGININNIINENIPIKLNDNHPEIDNLKEIYIFTRSPLSLIKSNLRLKNTTNIKYAIEKLESMEPNFRVNESESFVWIWIAKIISINNINVDKLLDNIEFLENHLSLNIKINYNEKNHRECIENITSIKNIFLQDKNILSFSENIIKHYEILSLSNYILYKNQYNIIDVIIKLTDIILLSKDKNNFYDETAIGLKYIENVYKNIIFTFLEIDDLKINKNQMKIFENISKMNEFSEITNNQNENRKIITSYLKERIENYKSKPQVIFPRNKILSEQNILTIFLNAIIIILIVTSFFIKNVIIINKIVLLVLLFIFAILFITILILRRKKDG